MAVSNGQAGGRGGTTRTRMRRHVRRLCGKRAIVTGASRGIGRAIAVAFGCEGARVLVNYAQNDEAAKGVVDEIVSAGGEAIAVRADVTELDDVERLFKCAGDHFGGLDVLVNNAAVTSFAPLMELTLEEFERVMRVNVRSVFLCTQAAVPFFRSEGRGRVVNISSTSGLIGPPNSSHYCASKGAVNALTRACATELRADNINVNAICPGGTETDMLLPHLQAEGFELDRPETVGPRRRLGRPGDIAGAAVFLASEEAAWVTGCLLTVDGGLTAA
jgi:3-oxoacyl-[acyl-carrier protein] reductase